MIGAMAALQKDTGQSEEKMWEINCLFPLYIFFLFAKEGPRGDGKFMVL